MKKRKDGRYAKKVTLPDGKKKFVYGASPSEVTKKERDLLREFESGVKLRDKTTVGEWAVEWFRSYKSKLRAKTRLNITNNYNLHILPYIASIPLRDVRPIHIQQAMNDIADKSEDLQRKVLSIMRQLFETAIQNHLLKENPAKGIKITPHAADDKIKFLSEEQQHTLMNSVTEPRARLFCALCLYAGLRKEEALGLMWSDIKDRELTVRRAVTFIKNQQDENHELKTKAANRKIPIVDVLQDVLDTSPRRSLYLITNASGGELTLTSFRRLWAHVTSSVPFHVHPHMLRHTYATILYNAGVDLKMAQYLMGHTDIRVTANIYTHIEKGKTTSAAQKINDFLAGSQKGSQNIKKA